MCVCVLTALSDGSRGGQVSVLSVHVVGATAGVVTQPDTKVLHLQGGLLMDLNESTAAATTIINTVDVFLQIFKMFSQKTPSAECVSVNLSDHE